MLANLRRKNLVNRSYIYSFLALTQKFIVCSACFLAIEKAVQTLLSTSSLPLAELEKTSKVRTKQLLL